MLPLGEMVLLALVDEGLALEEVELGLGAAYEVGLALDDGAADEVVEAFFSYTAGVVEAFFS